METTDLFPTGNALGDLEARNKTELLHALSAEAARRLGLPETEVFEALRSREALGSTGLGKGIALPHARLPGEHQPVALLARLRRPIDFEAKDDEAVDLVLAVLWPDEEAEGFLPALSGVCRALRDPQVPRRMRRAETPEAALTVLREALSQGGGPVPDPA
ncbi:PTS sugar transporter subunit IIA [Roseomonas sp. NAR14]|uniref:PTS sugar transporter subunit IIA n=1 Tax=Roseomonas acroporae TaxID=2937791 RepID=A0A9X2BVR5_9PROT|nr:PTS sugar transporter subunit IIA [Roseomonas acroporae]MCK8783030.1 PTS sugar transporter subunit IIA [Roseomonas acroporae]